MDNLVEIKEISKEGSIDGDLMPQSIYGTRVFLSAFFKPGWQEFIKIPMHVKIHLSELCFEWNTKIYGIHDDMGHGGLGKVIFIPNFRKGSKSIDDNFVIARVSFGNSYDKFKNVTWSSDRYQRLHLGALAVKYFMEKGEPHMEKAYFTLRWDKGKFLNETQKAKGKQYALINMRRVTFSQAKIFDRDKENKYRADEHVFKPAPFKKELMNDEFGRMPLQERIFLECPNCREDIESTDAKVTSRLYHHMHEVLEGAPDIGYEHVPSGLSKYGDVSKKDISSIIKMDPIEGTTYFFTKIVPAMADYVDCRRK